jgi:hypothetical protein
MHCLKSFSFSKIGIGFVLLISGISDSPDIHSSCYTCLIRIDPLNYVEISV